ncbi:AAA family ATPase [Hyphomonas sp. CY54-11-8]|uniref:AAA family ATPase n=1 Tax=Hyphomonas sp. CY54-11-8 TaxID=1280944 RepID=UPI000458CAFA|nr:AAA family ATPase [Hyphomonas sp. CY54-11-8]KCZ48490.1 hypothetical protein HY17_16710 [Hyphomonas sp. CY54-11-8]
MRIRSISLNNVRRFIKPVRIEGLTDGLNVLCEPNEFGKSTVFDALQAVFFKAHGSSDKEVKSLRPHAGGAPEVSIDIEIEDGIYTISKRWISKPAVTIEKQGRLVAQADEAESWITNLLGREDGGPSGLLWVRQGLTALSEGSKKEKDAALEARRDLLSSVTGEVEAMTGGRRMDMALARCREELLGFATPTGRPKAGGPWKEAEERVERLQAQRDELAEMVRQLREHLEERKRKRRELVELEDADASAARRQRLKDATSEFQAAERYAESLDAEARKVDAGRLRVSNLQSRLDGLRHALKERDEANEGVVGTTSDAEALKGTLTSCEEKRAEAQKHFDDIQSVYQLAQDAFRSSQRRQAALDGAERRQELSDRIKKAQASREEMEAAAANAQRGPDIKALRKLEELASALIVAQSIRDSEATQLVMSYDPGVSARIKLDGTDLPHSQAVAIPHGADLDVEGLGKLSIRAGAGSQDDNTVEKAEQALLDGLQKFGCSTIEEARDAAEARNAAERTRAEAQASLETLAPDGIGDLRTRLAAIPVLDDDDEEDVPALAVAEQLLLEADEARLKAEADRNMAVEHLADARAASSRADAAFEAAHARLSRAEASLERLGDLDQNSLEEELDRAATALRAAEALLKEKIQSAPDLKTVEAKLQRAQSIEETARSEIARLKPALATLDTEITRSAGDAVEERLAETEQQLKAAQVVFASIEREVAILQRLGSVLEEARSEAHERYFEPVAVELRPLLQLLWPDAELVWEDKTLLPTALVRDGQEESIEVLSGGTQEQIALLVRLAFARMLATRGQSAPIILDDALVFTDDDRIETMFDALHRQAGDLQILVLSCRQRAFRDLGGNTLRLN